MSILQFKSYFAQLLPKQLLLKDEIASTSVVSYVNYYTNDDISVFITGTCSDTVIIIIAR